MLRFGSGHGSGLVSGFLAVSMISTLGCGPRAPAGPASPPPGLGAGAAELAFSSELTPLYPSKECETVVPAEDGGDPVLRCPALRGFQVQVSFSAWATHVELTGPSTSVNVNGLVGDHLEWRLADGVPFAVIVSVDEQGPDESGATDPAARKLQIRGVGGWRIEAEVPAGAQDAEQAARKVAEEAYRATAERGGAAPSASRLRR